MNTTKNLSSSLLQPSLETVHEAFIQWRKSRKSQRDKIPNHLWELVGQIIDRYKISKIMSKLSINSAQLNRAGLSTRHRQDNNKEAENTFVNISLSPNSLGKMSRSERPTPMMPLNLQLILEHGDNKRLIVNSPCSEQVNDIVKQFLR